MYIKIHISFKLYIELTLNYLKVLVIWLLH